MTEIGKDAANTRANRGARNGRQRPFNFFEVFVLNRIGLFYIPVAVGLAVDQDELRLRFVFGEERHNVKAQQCRHKEAESNLMHDWMFVTAIWNGKRNDF